jgi:hypothetical protein
MSTSEHDAGVALVIAGTPGAMPSTGAQLIATETTFESRVTDVTARTAKSHVVPLLTLTCVDVKFPSAAPADHDVCLAESSFDITLYDPVGDDALSNHVRFTFGDAPHDTVGVPRTSEEDGERKR